MRSNNSSQGQYLISAFSTLTACTALAKLARLMPSDLPQTVNPVRLAKAAENLSGSIGLGTLYRLQPLLLEQDGEVEFELRFSQDDNGNCIVTGQCDTTLVVACQRCFQPMSLEVHSDINLMVVHSEAAANQIPDQYEPLLVTEDSVRLSDTIEDEVLLSMPFSALHETEMCHAEEETVENGQRENPFAILEKLKH